MAQAQVSSLARVLVATFSHDNTERAAAEAQLSAAASQPGFCRLLAALALESAAPAEVRQQSALTLKRFVAGGHWLGDGALLGPGAPSPPPPAEKREVHALLLRGLSDPVSKLRTAVGMAVAAVAKCDWPEEWPELMPELLARVSSQTDAAAVHGHPHPHQHRHPHPYPHPHPHLLAGEALRPRSQVLLDAHLRG